MATGDGIRRIFDNLRVQQVVTGGQSMNPSTAQLLEAVEAVPAPEVVILPNNKNIIAVAEQVDALTRQDGAGRADPIDHRGLRRPHRLRPRGRRRGQRGRDGRAAEAVVPGEVTQAVRDSTCDAGPIAEGDWLGIGRDGIEVVHAELGRGLPAAARRT